MRATGTYLVATLFASEWAASGQMKVPPEVNSKAQAAKASHHRMFRHAVELGVKIGYGTDAAVFPHGMNASDFAIMVKLGMSPAAALKSATSINADLLGLASQVGTLEEGKLADIVAIPGDVLQDIEATKRVSFVMKNGVVVRMA